MFLCSPPRWLFRDGLLPEQTYFVGFARSDLTVDAIRTACMPYLKVKLDLRCNVFEGRWREFISDTYPPPPFLFSSIFFYVCIFEKSLLSRWIKCKRYHSLTQVTDIETERLSAFFSRNTYISGKYADESSFSRLDKHILSLPGGSEANRLFYLALPPTVYHDVTRNIKHCCMSTKSVHKLILPAVSHWLLVCLLSCYVRMFVNT